MESWVEYTSQTLDVHAFSLIAYFLGEIFLSLLSLFRDSTHVAVYEPASVLQVPKAHVHKQFFFT